MMQKFESDLRERIVVQDRDSSSLAVEAEFYDMLDTVPAKPAELGLRLG